MEEDALRGREGRRRREARRRAKTTRINEILVLYISYTFTLPYVLE